MDARRGGVKKRKARIAKERALVASLYALSGGDVTRCEFCNKPLKFRRGLDGDGAHEKCLPSGIDSPGFM